MRKLAFLLGIPFLLAPPAPASAQILSYAITTLESTADVLFDPALGTLTSVDIEFKFDSFAYYEDLDVLLPGNMSPFDVTFSGEAQIAAYDDIDARMGLFSWTIPGHSDGGFPSGYHYAYSTGSFSQTYTSQSVLDLFTFREGDLGVSVYPSVYGIDCSPQAVYDEFGNRYDLSLSDVGFGDGVVVTYNYEVPSPVPEPELLLGPGMALMLLWGLRSHRRP